MKEYFVNSLAIVSILRPYWPNHCWSKQVNSSAVMRKTEGNRCLGGRWQEEHKETIEREAAKSPQRENVKKRYSVFKQASNESQHTESFSFRLWQRWLFVCICKATDSIQGQSGVWRCELERESYCSNCIRLWSSRRNGYSRWRARSQPCTTMMVESLLLINK